MKWVLVLGVLVLAMTAGAVENRTFPGSTKMDSAIITDLVVSTIRGLYDHWDIAVSDGDVTFSAGGSLTFDAADGVVLAELAATTMELDTLTVNDVFNYAWAGGEQVWADYVYVDTTLECDGNATIGDNLVVDSCLYVRGDSVVVTSVFADWMSLLGDGHFWGECTFDTLVSVNDNMEIDQNLLVGDTLGVNIANPEYLFHVYNPGVYSMFEGDNGNDDTYVVVNTNHATQEVGFGIMRLDTLKWGVEDSNGTFIIWDVDDSQNAIMIADSICTVTVVANLSVGGDVTVTDSVYAGGNVVFGGDVTVTGGGAVDLGGATDTLVVGADSVEIINGVITRIF